MSGSKEPANDTAPSADKAAGVNEGKVLDPKSDTVEAVEDDYDEEEDDDYDPSAKADEGEREEGGESDSDKGEYDYGKIVLNTTQVRTRNQRYKEKQQGKTKTTNIIGEVSKNIDFDSIFNDLKLKSVEGKPIDWNEVIGTEETEQDTKPIELKPKPSTLIQDEENPKVWIKTSYVFAGKVITEEKQVDANSAEASAYMNSAAGLQMDKENRSFVPIIRTVKGYDEPLQLRIKLKRPSLIDKFLSTKGSKHQKLSTLEKSRLDWASFVDANKINDELKLHNKDGYLEKQDFLGRVDAKRDQNYASAREADRIKRWQDQQKL